MILHIVIYFSNHCKKLVRRFDLYVSGSCRYITNPMFENRILDMLSDILLLIKYSKGGGWALFDVWYYVAAGGILRHLPGVCIVLVILLLALENSLASSYLSFNFKSASIS